MESLVSKLDQGSICRSENKIGHTKRSLVHSQTGQDENTIKIGMRLIQNNQREETHAWYSSFLCHIQAFFTGPIFPANNSQLSLELVKQSFKPGACTTHFCNKLECLYLASLSSPVKCLQVFAGEAPLRCWIGLPRTNTLAYYNNP